MNDIETVASADTWYLYGDGLLLELGMDTTLLLSRIINIYTQLNFTTDYFECSVVSIRREIEMSAHRQRISIEKLTKLGIIKTKNSDLPATRKVKLCNTNIINTVKDVYGGEEGGGFEQNKSVEFELIFPKTQLYITYITLYSLYYLLIINNRVIKNDNSYLSTLNFFSNRKILSFEEREKKTKEKNNELKNKILSDENFLEIIRTFSDFPAPAVTHNVNKITNTLAEAYSLYQHLLNGTFFDNCKQITEPWIVANKGDWSKLKEKKWKHKKIMKVLKEAGKPYLPDYYPFSKDDKKKILPKSLPQLFYNPFVKKCPSSFIRAYLQPPKLSPVQEITDKYPGITTEISQMCDVTPRIIIRAITYLEPFYNEICNKSIIFEDGKKYTRLSLDMEFSRHLGTFVKFLGVYVEWLGSLSEKWRNQQSVRLAGVTRGWFDEYLKKNYDIILEPNDSYLQRLARDLKRMKSGY